MCKNSKQATQVISTVMLVQEKAVNAALFLFSLFINDLVGFVRVEGSHGVFVSQDTEECLVLMYTKPILWYGADIWGYQYVEKIEKV